MGADEIIAAGDAIDEGKRLSRAMSSIFHVDIPVVVALDRHDLLMSLRMQRNCVEKIIPCEVNVIRYEFERQSVAKVVWISGNQKLADPAPRATVR